MSRENVEIVRRGYEAMRNRDLHAVLELTDPEFEGTFRILEVEGTTYRGHEGMRRFAEEVWSVFPDWNPEVVSVREVADNLLLLHVRGTGRGVGSGVELDLTAWQIFKVRDGRVLSMRGYRTEADALEAVGLSE
jgi:ketosteroid isomerase-like protein